MGLPEATQIYGFLQRPSLVDFPGSISAVLFTSGCNFSCGYCHNAPLMGSREAGLSADELRMAIDRFRKKDWIDGVTITGGEPTLVPHLPQLVTWFKDQGLRVKLDTNGSHPDMLEGLLDQLDYVAMDVKCALEHYRSFVSYGQSERIRGSVDLLKAGNTAYEFRTTVLASFHTRSEMLSIGKLIEGAACYTLQPFVPRDNLPDPALRTLPRTSPDLLKEYAQLMHPYARTIKIAGR
ncbi:MAG: anaerobic ribonucleoside-triphosphate reductase activating protein [Spirochaetia bacterium]|nr:anaerobic ribonucleoside-triphosphate reductase activating protein [Spirochaetia bacterium]